ncbi:MAG TPA: SpvB/TcaC N-terminal domain-containing protein, partial [Polyangiaceae bacterium]
MAQGWIGSGIALLATVALLMGCSSSPQESAVGNLSQAVVTSVSMTFPAGVGRLDAPVNASSSIKLADNVKVLDNASEPGATSNSGTGETYIGPGSSAGRITTRGTVNLRPGSSVGDVIASGTITKLSGAKVLGIEVSNAVLTPLTTISFGVDFPSSVPAEIMVEPNVVRTLTAGNYSSVVVKPNATLILGPGDYTFRTLDLQADSTTYLRDGVKISVRDQLLFKGAAWAWNGVPPRLPGTPPVWNIVYTGSSEIGVNSLFQGSLIAPRAKINLAAKAHTGWFYGAQVEIQAGGSVRARPGTQVCIPTQACETIPLPPTTTRLALPAPISTVPPAAVGAVPWSFDVTAAGQAAYSVPIEVPPGPGDVAPSLSLGYTSSQTPGIAGTGWSLSGLSGIVRCAKSSGTDGIPSGISDTASDRL